MDSMRQVGAALLLGLVSVLIVLGGFSLAMAEGGLVPAALPASPTVSSSASIIVTIFPTLPLPESATPAVAAPVSTDTPVSNFTATTSLTPPATLTICPPPSGWVPVVVQANDTLASLSLVYRTSA